MMKLKIKSKSFDYDVIIENNLLDNIQTYLDFNKEYILIHDDNIPNDIVKKICHNLKVKLLLDFPQGEQSKSMYQFERIINLLIQNNTTKDDIIIALGGGVTGDLVGFISSTLYRGVDYIQIPTTLLAQIDSSIGGKVAINTQYAKNCIGNFYPPKKVLIDPTTLKSLPERHFNNGVAEMIKYGLIKSKPLYDSLKKNDIKSHLDSLIYDSLCIKKALVEEDEFDIGNRQLLNFGHTYGHAYEAYYNYEKYLHGEAVSLGMIRMIAEDLRLDLIEVLKKYSLPISDSANDTDLIKYIRIDKKAKKGTINVIKVNKVGKAIIEAVKINKLLNGVD